MHVACSGTSIGKRYARTDELGVPYDITVDGDTVEKDGTVTLRERDTTAQVGLSIQRRTPKKGFAAWKMRGHACLAQV